MKRFIRYLYEYGQGKRMRNVGFVKVEQGEDECVVHIHGKGLRMGSDRSLQIYLLFEDNGKCYGIWQGEADNINPAVNERISYTVEEVGTPENYARINGLVLENRDGRRYAALWDEMPMDISDMRIWNPERAEGMKKSGETERAESPEEAGEPERAKGPEEAGEPERAKDPEEAGEPERAKDPEGAGEPEGTESPEEAGEPEGTESPEEAGEPGGTESPEEAREPGGTESPEEARGPDGAESTESLEGADQPEGLGEMEEEQQEYDDFTEEVPAVRSEDLFFLDETENTRPQTRWRTKKIQRTELARLARCEWRLANNNFLLHGYYNYHHLILMERGEQLMLGVPGIYHEKEAAAAGAFGFAEFIAKDRLDIKLSPEEYNEEHPFGYWCRPVKRAFKWE